MHILDYEAPGLAQRLEAMAPEERRRALTKAALTLSEHVTDMEPSLRYLLDTALAKNFLTPEEVAEAKAYANSSDAQHFASEAQGAAEAISGNWFSKARLAMAIANAFGGSSWQDAADAAYELCFTLDDKPAAIALVRTQVEGTLTID